MDERESVTKPSAAFRPRAAQSIEEYDNGISRAPADIVLDAIESSRDLKLYHDALRRQK